MKKITKLIALLLAMCFIFCACGEKEESGTNTDEEYGNFQYSEGLDENGFWEGVTATDYVTLPSLDKIVVSQADLAEDIEDVMTSTDYMNAVNDTSATATIANGSTVNIDYVGSINGVEFDGGSTGGNGTDVTIGVTNYIDDFLEQLIGHHPGETVNVEVTFPDDYGNEELNGKDALFVTKINYIVTYERNELNDEFVTEYFADNGWTTVEEFKEGCAWYLAEEQFLDAAQYADTLPSQIGEAYVGRMMDGLYQSAQSYGLDMDTYISYAYSSYGITSAAQVKLAYQTYQDVVAKEFLAYQAIAEAKGMTVTDEDLDKYYETYGVAEENIDAVIEEYGLPYIKSMALYDKALEFIHSITVVE